MPASAHASSIRRAFAVATAGLTFVLLVAGGLVTSTDSGLAVPDWPLSYGTLFPPMVGGILYEHGHRMAAAAVGVLILILAVWLHRAEPRPWVRRLGWATLAGVMIQGLLGGLTVIWLLPPQVSIAHACLGPTVFTLTACLAWAVASPDAAPRPVPDAAWPPLTTFTLAVAVMAAAQLLFGAILRHTGLGLGAHLAGASVLAISVLSLAVRVRRDCVPGSIRQAALRLVALLLVQAGLGLASLRWPLDVAVVTAHQACGALVLAQSVWTAWMSQRLTVVPRPAYPIPAGEAQ